MYWIINRIRNSKFCFVIIFLGFFISMIALSIGTSIISQINKITNDYSNGSFKYVKRVNLSFKDSYQISDLTSLFEKDFINSDIAVEFVPIQTENYETIIVTGILSKDKYLWTPPMEKGEFLGNKVNDRVAVVGRKVFNGVENNELTIEGKKYKIVGTFGKKEESAINREVFVPINYIPEILGKRLNPKVFQFVVKANINPKVEIDKFNEDFLNQYPNAVISVDKDERIDKARGDLIRMYKPNLNDVIKMLFISILNTINISYFWIHSRKKEIALRKAIGSSNQAIYILILKEIIFICTLASGTAFVFLAAITRVSTKIFSYEINLSLSGFVFSIIVSLLTCLITALVPSLIAFKVEPAVVIKE
ncbi:hypothetical protein CSC2_22630 [Clostridium zeae]|uniref:ABC3 transporter permease C-terminal domain-containing protein n=1 Tax=Clostridium zeae TaxID=2759022 RepID=A0ABQ1EAC3_9CLOT|nr:ABC transporter permease [Clostridium zeae]GFZ31737.1 hypothetical protein CSC2_22630 [Clostridium zeae]